MTNERIKSAQQLLKEMNLEGWVIITNQGRDLHTTLLLGKKNPGRSLILVTPDKSPSVIVSQMEAPIFEDVAGIEVIPYPSNEQFLEHIQNEFSQFSDNSQLILNYVDDPLGRDGTFDLATYGEVNKLKTMFPEIEFKPAAPFLKKLRTIKTDSEIRAHEMACKYTLEILEDVPNFVHIGMSEREILSEIDCRIKRVGEPSFDTIVGVGPDAASPHHVPSSFEKLGTDELLLIDMGVFITDPSPASSDQTWTFYTGTPTEKTRQMYEAVSEAKERVIKAAKPGIPAYTLDEIARATIEEFGFDEKKLFIHATGHPLGIEVHDVGPIISRKSPYSEQLLEPNMIITVEPGLYIKGVGGIRLEDDIVITKKGCKRLSYTPPELVQIG
ncbi:MAG: M24 family metallopeptidase [Promethearchaeota archaeon]